MRILFIDPGYRRGAPEGGSVARRSRDSRRVCTRWISRWAAAGKSHRAPGQGEVALEHAGTSVKHLRTCGTVARMPTSGRWSRPHRGGGLTPHPARVRAEARRSMVASTCMCKPRARAPRQSLQWVVLNGDTETGVSIMQMDEGLDNLAMCWSLREDRHRSEETSGELFDCHRRRKSLRVPVRRCPPWKLALTKPQPQQHENAGYPGPMLEPGELAEFRLLTDTLRTSTTARGMNPRSMACS